MRDPEMFLWLSLLMIGLSLAGFGLLLWDWYHQKHARHAHR
jgi:hypothetical protein